MLGAFIGASARPAGGFGAATPAARLVPWLLAFCLTLVAGTAAMMTGAPGGLGGLEIGNVAYAADAGQVTQLKPAWGKPPVSDAAFVAELPGIRTVAARGFVRVIPLYEGIVIRASAIQDGKIVIPPAGLYYSSRAPKVKPLQGDSMILLGQRWYFVDYASHFEIQKNIEFRVGMCRPYGDGSKCLRLSSISNDFAGQTPVATFQILKPSGNYYPTEFRVTTSELFLPAASLANGTTRQAGAIAAVPESPWYREFYGSNVATSGQTYVVADEVSESGVKLKEWGTGWIDWLLFSTSAPKTVKLGVGESAKIGDFTIKVTGVKETAGVVGVAILDGNGKVLASKSLGPLTTETRRYLPEDQLARETMMLRYEDQIQVEMDAFRKPFADGKASLVVYTNLVKLPNPAVWPGDARFVARPDT